MEQKKTLWIIAATGVFLLVVIGAAIILYSPANYPIPTVASVQVPAQNPSGGWALPSQQDTSSAMTLPQGDQKAPENTSAYQESIPTPIHQIHDLTVIAENTNVYNVTRQGETTTIDLNTLKTAAEEINKTQVETAVQQKSVQKTETQKAQPSKSVDKPAPKSAPKSAPQKSTVSVQKAKYWVQAAAYTSKKTADNARSVLSENKIPAEVFTYTDAKSKVYYRVRVGPYTTKSEAEYWKTKILQIDQFKDSKAYITDTTAAK